MKFLVVYYSYTDNNRKIARLIRQKLNCDIMRIEELKKRTGFTILLDVLLNRFSSIKTDLRCLRDYEHIVFVAPIWAGKIASPMKTFLQREKNSIQEYSFVTVCSGVKGQLIKIERQLTTLVGKGPDGVLQLCVNDLLPDSMKNKIRYVTNYRLDGDDIATFEPKVNKFLMTKDLLLSYLPR